MLFGIDILEMYHRDGEMSGERANEQMFGGKKTSRTRGPASELLYLTKENVQGFFFLSALHRSRNNRNIIITLRIRLRGNIWVCLEDIFGSRFLSD